jgi:hypothetical protein
VSNATCWQAAQSTFTKSLCQRSSIRAAWRGSILAPFVPGTFQKARGRGCVNGHRAKEGSRGPFGRAGAGNANQVGAGCAIERHWATRGKPICASVATAGTVGKRLTRPAIRPFEDPQPYARDPLVASTVRARGHTY